MCQCKGVSLILCYYISHCQCEGVSLHFPVRLWFVGKGLVLGVIGARGESKWFNWSII